MRYLLPIAALAMTASGCASITQGTDQQVSIGSNPAGARCELTRSGEVIAVADPTPEIVTIGKSRKDIQVACTKPGYRETKGILGSDVAGMTFGNIIAGGIIGLAVDAGTGAMNKYDNQIVVPLVADEGTIVPAPASTITTEGEPVS